MKDYSVTISRDKNFRLLQIGDLHLAYRNGCSSYNRTLGLIRDAVTAAKPDFIAMTGDLSVCPDTEKIYREFCEFMDSFGIPWGFCFGNHDRDCVPDPKCLENILENSKTCLYHNDCPSVFGYGNYCIKIVDNANKPLHVLYFFDNGLCHRYDGLAPYACGSFFQNRWFRENQLELKRNGDRFCVWGFVHMPLHEYRDCYNAGKTVGERNGDEAFCPINTGLFFTMGEDKYTKGIFCGHDHGSSYMGEYCGIKLIYGRTTGFELTKGSISAAPYGVRICDITPSGDLSTFFYLEDGKMTNQDGTPYEKQC